MNPIHKNILGNTSATYVLFFLENFGEGHASRISKTFDVSVMGIQRQLQRFEENGILVSNLVGNTRVFKFNDRNPTVQNLRTFLSAELEILPKPIIKKYFKARQGSGRIP